MLKGAWGGIRSWVRRENQITCMKTRRARAAFVGEIECNDANGREMESLARKAADQLNDVQREGKAERGKSADRFKHALVGAFQTFWLIPVGQSIIRRMSDWLPGRPTFQTGRLMPFD